MPELDAATIRALRSGDVAPLARLIADLDVDDVVELLDQLSELPPWADDPDALFDLRIALILELDPQPEASGRLGEALETIASRGVDEQETAELADRLTPAIPAAREGDVGPLATILAGLPVNEAAALMLTLENEVEPWASDPAEGFRLVLMLGGEFELVRGDKEAADHFVAAMELVGQVGARLNDANWAHAPLPPRIVRTRLARLDAANRLAMRSAIRSLGYRMPRDLRWKIRSVGQRRRGRRGRPGRTPRRARARSPGRGAAADDHPDARAALLRGEERRP
jgi:hypothetical protein